MKKLLILSLCALGSMFARDCGCNKPVERVEVIEKAPAAACPTVYVSEIPVCQELRLVNVPAQREIYYSCPTPSDAHNTAVNAFATTN
jgi:hypothetical protein